jgi:hypothetical protein
MGSNGVRRIVVALLCAAGLSAHAARTHTQFRWTDGSGTPHFSDTLTMDALQYGYDVLSDKGVVVKHVDRQRTPEELFAEEQTAAAAAAQKREAEAQAQSEKRMLAAYPTEKDFTTARQAQLESIDQNVRAANNSLGVQEKSLSDALAQASGFEHSGKPVPDTVKKQIESLRKSAESLRAYIARRQAEKTEAAKRFDADLQRYRAARARGAIEQPSGS